MLYKKKVTILQNYSPLKLKLQLVRLQSIKHMVDSAKSKDHPNTFYHSSLCFFFTSLTDIMVCAYQLNVQINLVSWSVCMECGASDICVVIGSKTHESSLWYQQSSRGMREERAPF